MLQLDFYQHKLCLLVLLAILFSLTIQPVSAAQIFGSEINLSSNAGGSALPKLSASGNHVYAVWQDNTSGNNEILFKASSDDGASFGSELNLSQSPAVSSTASRISSIGNNVYVAWIEGNEILFKASQDNGANFGSPITLSITSGTAATLPQITAMGSSVYVVWRDDNEIYFRASSNSGTSFGVEINLSNTASFSSSPQVASAGNSVYVVWQEGSGTAAEILFKASSDNGASFGSELNLSNSATIPSDTAQIVAVDNSVYVTWEEGATADILFKSSSDNGANFSTEINLSSNTGGSLSPQISSSGSNMYVLWQDSTPGNSDILFIASTDNGVSFGGEINLSGDAGVSSAPQVVSSGTNVYVVWQDSASTDIFSKSSSDSGATFGGVTNISNNAGVSSSPQISSSGSNVYVLWQDSTPGNSDILFKAGADVPIQVVFDQSNYKLTDTTTVTVTDQGANTDSGLAETILVTIKSTLDPSTGISLILTETGDDTGIFDGSFTFTTTPPSTGTILLAAPGNIITASYNGLLSTSNIFPRTVAFDVSNYNLGDIAHITVIDQNSNLDDLVSEIIDVTVTSTAHPGGIILSLTETSPSSGIFGGPSSNLIFMSGDYLIPVSSTVTVNQHDEDDNADPNIADTTTVKITSNSDPIGITLTLTETGVDTSEFSGELSLSTDSSVDGSTIKVAEGDFLSVSHEFLVTKAMITPNPNPANGAIQVGFPAPESVKATYLDDFDIETVTTTDAPGGGGGGLVRPGLVVNVVAGISAFGSGGGGGNSPPSFGQSSFAIITGGEEGFGGILNDNDAKTLEEPKTIKVGEKAVLRFDYFEGGGIGKIEHIGLYTNVRDGQKRQDSDAYIYYDPLKSPQVSVHDPNGLFSEVKFDLLEEAATKFVLKYELTFAKPMAKSDLILEGWNTHKWSSITKIPNAIEVVSSGIVQETSSNPIAETFTEDITNDEVIPVWVKTNAKWWSDDEIDSENFISGIEYLVNEGIIKVSLQETTSNASVSELQSWIKNTAGWWADDMISDDEFLTAIEWLISNNIIQVV